MESVYAFASSKQGKDRYPKLKAALDDLNTMVGMSDVKENIANEIKQLLAYVMLDAPARSSPIQ